MSSNQRICVFALLAVVLGVWNVLLTRPNVIPIVETRWTDFRDCFVAGFLYAQLAMIGLWVVFGGLPLAVRLSGGLVLTSLFSYIAALIDMPIVGPTAAPRLAWVGPLFAMCACAVAQLPYWWLWRRRGWRLADQRGANVRVVRKRMSLATLMACVTLLSAFGAIWRLLANLLGQQVHLDFESSRYPLSTLGDAITLVIMFAIIGSYLILHLDVVLARSRNWRFAPALAMSFAIPVFSESIVSNGKASNAINGPAVVAALVSGVSACALIVLLVARASGLRLYRPLAGDVLPAPLEPGESAGRASPLRFAALIGCVAALGALVLLLEGRL